MDKGVLTVAQLAAAIAAWTGAFTAVKIRLFTDAIQIQPGTNISNLTEPTASWYTEANATIDSLINDGNYGLIQPFGHAEWTYSGSDGPTTVQGWTLTDVPGGNASNNTFAAGNLVPPVTIQKTYDGVVVDPALDFPLPNG